MSHQDISSLLKTFSGGRLNPQSPLPPYAFEAAQAMANASNERSGRPNVLEDIALSPAQKMELYLTAMARGCHIEITARDSVSSDVKIWGTSHV